MADQPRDPPESGPPDEDETVVVPPDDETVIQDEWAVAPERRVPQTTVVQDVEEEPPERRAPTLWPWLLALLVLVLAGLAAYFLTRDDDEAATTTSAATTAVQRVAVPDVVGSTAGEATATLQARGLEANIVLVPSDAPSGEVVAQDPAAGDEAETGSRVRLNVAQEGDETTTPPTTTAPATTAPTTTAPAPEPQPAVVPDVVGQPVADAARAFGAEGLRVDLFLVPSEEPAGTVVAQAQEPGTELQPGDTVQVNVSAGAPTDYLSVPDVVGRPLDEARQALEQARFEVLALNLDDEIRNTDTVELQTPEASAATPRGSLVVIYVTR